jgi:Ulp1 protease family, C-terminal catalytic domain
MQIFMPLHRDNHWYLGVLDKDKNQFQILDSAFWEIKVSEYEIATSNLVC